MCFLLHKAELIKDVKVNYGFTSSSTNKRMYVCYISKQTVENILPRIIKRTILFIPAFKETHNT